MPDDFESCRLVIHAWAIGGQVSLWKARLAMSSSAAWVMRYSSKLRSRKLGIPTTPVCDQSLYTLLDFFIRYFVVESDKKLFNNF